ncbi:MAG: transposase [Rhodobacteraceae bacterium]|nr:MAG: transposase [Paracoccaceae bacterium]
MSKSAPDREWWSPAALAQSGLPDVPGTRQGVDALAKRLDWRADPTLARRRSGRGGGWEYHWKLLPVRAQAVLLRSSEAREEDRADRGTVWAYFDALAEKSKETARERLRVIQKIEHLAAPMGRHLAVVAVSKDEGVSERTLWNWLSLIEGVDPADWLAYLAPRHRAAKANRATAEADQEFFDRLKADYLRLEAPSFTSCYDRVADLCKTRGWSYLEERTARRWMDRNVPRVTQVLAREGERGLAKCFPPQIRDRSMLTALEAVNADCHKIDVFVAWPGFDKPVRPQIVAFQDLYSNKILSWRVDLDPNKVAVMSAFGELVEKYGIMRHCLFDNGMEFANKWLTGGAKTRFRFKIREDDALGVLPQMGIKIHWAKPAHGQAKPIERGFKDFADRIAKHPAFAGAYVGNTPLAKPENYGSRAIPLDQFLAVLDREIKAHNARPGRATPNAAGRSFDETFAESYATAPIRKATPEQHRLWLMGQEVRKLHKTHGQFHLFDNGYWADWMNEFAGQKVVARFDPEHLHEGLYIYSLAGEYLGFAECRAKTGFFDLVGAQMQGKLDRKRRKAEKEALAAQRPMSVSDLAAELAAQDVPETPLVAAKVVELAPVRHRKPVVERQLPVPDAELDARARVFEAEFGQRSAQRKEAEKPAETASERFWRALGIEQRIEAGDAVTTEEEAFLERMKRLPEYRAQRTAYEKWGAQAIG